MAINLSLATTIGVPAVGTIAGTSIQEVASVWDGANVHVFLAQNTATIAYYRFGQTAATGNLTSTTGTLTTPSGTISNVSAVLIGSTIHVIGTNPTTKTIQYWRVPTNATGAVGSPICSFSNGAAPTNSPNSNKIIYDGVNLHILASESNQVIYFRVDPGISANVTSVTATFSGITNPFRLDAVWEGSNIHLAVNASNANYYYRFAIDTTTNLTSPTINFTGGNNPNNVKIALGGGFLHVVASNFNTITYYRFTVTTVGTIGFTASVSVPSNAVGLAFFFDGTHLNVFENYGFSNTTFYFRFSTSVTSAQFSALVATTYSRNNGNWNFINVLWDGLYFHLFDLVIGQSSLSYTRSTQFDRRLTISQSLTLVVPASPIRRVASVLTLTGSVDGFSALFALRAGAAIPGLDYAFTATSDSAGTLNENFVYSGSAAEIAGDYRIVMGASRTLTLGTKGTYSDSFTLPSTGTLALSANTVITTEMVLVAGTTISGAYSLTIPYADPGLVLTNGATLIAPSIALNAPNFENGTRFYAARRQTFLIASASINTGGNTIALGNDLETGAAFAGRITNPATLAYVLLAAGAIKPTSTPQIESGNLYYVSANTSGVIQISESQGGAPLDFSTAGTNNGSGQVLIIVCATELINTTVSGGTGINQALTLPNNAQLEVAAQNIASGEATATTLFHRVLNWNSTTGATIAETFSLANNPDEIYNALIGEPIKSKRGLTVTITSTPSAVAGLAFDLSGNIEIDANAIVDASIAAPDAYLWMVSQRYTQAGIRFIRDQLIALSIMEFDLTGQLKIDNTADGIRNSPATPLVVFGNVYTAEGASIFADNTGSVRFEPFFVATSTGDGGFTSADRAQLAALNATLEDVGRFSEDALANAPSGSNSGFTGLV